jgi:2-polyprenyl-6-methoxyphenol hydroxylase-like FAD-dependent oxidoreductase
MSRTSDRHVDVLVVGAGPTGLVLALWLARLGVHVRIVDKTAEPGTTSRAVAVQARTLEFYSQMGLAAALVESGRKALAANLWVAGQRAARAVLGDMGAGLSPYPYALVYPQDEHERLLLARLAEAGVAVERRTELVKLEETADRVHAVLKAAEGSEDRCDAAYVAGCDGAHSTVRAALQIGFPGGTYAHLFYVADVMASGEAINGEVHVGMDATDFLAVFPLKAAGHARLIGTVRLDAGQPQDNLSWDEVGKRVIEWMRIDVERVHWFSTYRVHHRVADQFRGGRAFVVGDAAHIHSPVGGQGMNTGIGDAVNLAWKLAAVLRGHASPAVLDSYEPERIAFARRLVATTDRAFTAVTSDGPIARRVRLDIVPRVLPTLLKFAAARRFLFRTVSQTAVTYRGSGLSEGRAGTVHGGDRLPWVKMALNGVETDNFAPLASLDWQVHVYGEADRDIQETCKARALPLHVFPWQPAVADTGLRRNAVYLVRPDGYIGLAGADSGSALASYLDARRITPRGVDATPAQRPGPA